MAFLPAVVLALAFAQGPQSALDEVPAKYRPTAPAAGAAVARVNGIDIKASDVEALLWEWRGIDAIQDLIRYRVVKDEAEKLRISVSNDQVEKMVETGLKEMGERLQPGQTVEVVLLSQGFTKSRLFLRYKTEALLDAMVERSFAPKQLVKVSTLIFRPENEQSTSITDAVKRADDAYARLKKGEAWDKVLEATQPNAQVRQSKGLLGWRDLSAFPTTVRAELESMKKGGVTKPAQTPNGMQIFRLEAAGMQATPEEQKEMRLAYMSANKQPLLDRLQREARIERLYPPIPGLNSQKDGN